jgi:hypothetical protein
MAQSKNYKFRCREFRDFTHEQHRLHVASYPDLPLHIYSAKSLLMAVNLPPSSSAFAIATFIIFPATNTLEEQSADEVPGVTHY